MVKRFTWQYAKWPDTGTFGIDAPEFGEELILASDYDAIVQKWQPITAYRAGPEEYDKKSILWNGERVFVGWLFKGKWHDVANAEHRDRPEIPQPTHWMPLPESPVDNAIGDDK